MTEPRSALCRHCRSPLEAGQAFCTRCGAAIRIAASGEDPLRDRLDAVFGAELVVEREIGRGAMGAVFSAFDPALQRRVAVKALLPEVELDSAIAERFIREARIAAALQHPNIVSVHGVRSGAGVRAIVMQYVEGRGLDRVLTETPLVPLATAAKILADVCAALQHAHDRRVIHRDVKPANVLLGYDGATMVTDFGIARQFGATRITEEGLVMGTLSYISPEAAVGGEATAASDQYSLGIMAFELLVGVRPFLGSAQELLHSHPHVPAPSLALARPQLPTDVAEAVQRMLAKDPRVRWPTLSAIERVFRAHVGDSAATTRYMAQLSQPMPKAGSGVQRAVTTRVSAPVRMAATTPMTAQVGSLSAPGSIATIEPPPTVATPPARQYKKKALAPALAIVGVIIAVIAWQMVPRSSNGEQTGPPAPAPASIPAPEAARPASDAQAQRGSASQRDAGAQPNPGAAPVPVPAAPPVQRTDSTKPVNAPPVADTQATRANAPPVEPPPRPPTRVETPPVFATPGAALGDARKVVYEFVALVNKGRWREMELVPGTGGDAGARANVIRLVRTTTDVAAGLRGPSPPDMTAAGFETEFILELETTSGGKTQTTNFTIVVSGKHDGTAWHLAGWRVASAP